MPVGTIAAVLLAVLLIACGARTTGSVKAEGYGHDRRKVRCASAPSRRRLQPGATTGWQPWEGAAQCAVDEAEMARVPAPSVMENMISRAPRSSSRRALAT
jgi:hypothetical protein